ncbi:pyridoxal kinase PdxY [Nitratireductor sp. CAU 1489]|uniref:pyridoxal kinase n=1 Tax=Nitratireductor arenosus TaxID=2682096 RepID=A0A844QEX5_9HYPH|nr:pyridoxal kinase PdxY [Nitratireductor arenosus]MVA96580.1 pyridoxal kinase PdxY [Nitratireductor arenosus]
MIVAPANPSAKPAVIVISSHVARGSVGNRAAVFALESLGYRVWAVPTVILPWHPGHGPATRIVPDDSAFAALLRDLAGSPWLGEVGAVLSGYLGSPAQAQAVAALVEAAKARNPGLLYVCDPVIGDLGGLYVADALAAAIRDRLIPLADIATPNRYELEWMAGTRLSGLAAVADAARALGPEAMLVTSAPVRMPGATANLLVRGGAALLAEHRLIDNPPNGLGDLTAAVFLARVLGGATDANALESTTASVYAILAGTAARGGDELEIETDAHHLVDPALPVRVRAVSTDETDGAR